MSLTAALLGKAHRQAVETAKLTGFFIVLFLMVV